MSDIKKHWSEKEIDIRKGILDLFKNCQIPDSELLSNLGLFINRRNLTRILLMNELYKKILHIHGDVIEFGVKWGQNLALFQSFRGLYEPFNTSRKIIGFDTFEGFPSTHDKDGKDVEVAIGEYSTTKGYEDYLKLILEYHENESPLAHICKYRLVKGDATVEIDNYLQKNPETIIALAYFDFDLYEPTKKCLEAIKDHVTKGTIIAFDELAAHNFPGETLALKEVFGLSRFSITRSPFSSTQSYIVIE
jgi:hypothetical protein